MDTTAQVAAAKVQATADRAAADAKGAYGAGGDGRGFDILPDAGVRSGSWTQAQIRAHEERLHNPPAQSVEIVAVAPPGGNRMISLPWLITIVVAAIGLIAAAYYWNTHRPSLCDRNWSCTTPLDPHERGHWVLREWATPNESYRSAKPVVVAVAEVDAEIEVAAERAARREERRARLGLEAARSHQLAMATVASSRQPVAGMGQIVVVLDGEGDYFAPRRGARRAQVEEDTETECAARQARTHARQLAADEAAKKKKTEEEKPNPPK